MEKPTYTREQLQMLPAVVAKRQLDEKIKYAVSFIEASVVTEAKKGISSYVWVPPNPPADTVMEEMCNQLRKIFVTDVDISYADGKITVNWAT